MSSNYESGYSSDESPKSPSNIVIRRDERRFSRNYEIIDLLKKSANGVIYEGRHIRSNTVVIIKQIPRGTVTEYINVKGRDIPSEIYYQFKAYEASKTVIKPIDWFEKSSSFVLVMEKMENSIDLFEFSKIYGAIAEELAREIFVQILEGAEKLQAAGIIHRDFKNENILINPMTLEIKIIDFGCATEFEETYTSACGTMPYFPPEWFKYCEYKPEPLTVWSLGSILYILLTGEWDFESGNINRNFIKEHSLSKNCISLINSILCPFPSKRANFDSIFESKWLN